MSEPFTITTPRRLLRPVHPEDGPALYSLINNWNVVKWLAVVPWPYLPEDMTWFIENVATPRAATADPVFTLLVDGRTPIGVAECCSGAPADAAAADNFDLGFWIGAPYWGRGYMTEAVRALVAHAFSRPDTASIRSGVFEGNDRSLRVHEKLGFEQVGVAMSKCRSRGHHVPLRTLRLTRARFESR